ncbi:hypothetical protein PYW07_016602 [Mythimna separata]|uniref:Uncharacterized protein n=1 Tax=Mythimna separata TaxID=271217 RepID=A0AAD7YLY9_MYTSE|nr:hypothetical protein PYW07_016602 [Mythimna separata]
MDAFATSFLVQSKAQLSILRLDLEHVVEKSREEAVETSGDFRDILERRLKIILLHYNEIIKFSNLTQEIFGGAVMYLFTISGWIMCTTAYRLVSMKPMSVEFASMVMYMFCILIEVFMYCYYGNEVTYESEKLMESAYAMDWLVMPIKYRRALLLFMERIKRNINLVAGNLIPISNSTFVSVVRSSYTFYAFLKNSN